jgi:hypothetical protein
MSGWVRAAAAAAAAAAVSVLVALDVHPDPHGSRLGVIPLAAAMWAAFAVAAWLARRAPARAAVALIVLGAVAVQVAALSGPPRGSNDLYRYIWDGRVQAAGTDPYRYVPAARQLVPLRDPFLWPARAPYCIPPGARAEDRAGLLAPGCTRINRPRVPTIYPPAAEAYFLVVAEASPPGSGTLPIRAAAALCAIAVTVLLLYGLRSLGRDPRLAVLWAWCPAAALEAGNNAHADVLAALLAGAALLLVARPGRSRRSLAGGALLGLAITVKLTPALLLPAVARRRTAVVLSALTAAAAAYLPYLLAAGGGVIGFLPGYLRQEGYDDGSRFALIGWLVPGRWALAAAVAVLAAVALLVARRAEPDRPWRGALVMTGAALAVATPSYPWYALPLVMLTALDGRGEWLALAAARYLASRHPLAPVILTGMWPQRIGYGLALAVIGAAWLARRYRAAAGPPGTAGRPAPPGPAAAGLTRPRAAQPTDPGGRAAAARSTGAGGSRS